jgi:hypothetical protein
MGKFLLLFFLGILTAFMIAGGVLIARTYMVSADPSYTPENITITRLSPTSAEVSFTTESPVIASLVCSENKDGEMSLCGADSTEQTNHRIKTSIILNPDKEYYALIKIRNTSYDQLGVPFTVSLYSAPERNLNNSTQQPDSAESQESANSSSGFPTELLGVCEGKSVFKKEYDLNGDGCIRIADKLLYQQGYQQGLNPS